MSDFSNYSTKSKYYDSSNKFFKLFLQSEQLFCQANCSKF